MAQDRIKWEILPNGDIKITTDAVSDGNHLTADDLLAEIGRLAGGEVTHEKSDPHHHHEHTHTHGTVTHKH